MSNPESNPVHPDIRGVVYTCVIRNGDESHWNFLWTQYLKENFDSERDKILLALGASSNPEVIKTYLEKTLTEDVRLNDALLAYQGIGAFPPGKKNQFYWLKENWDKIQDHFGDRFDDTIVIMVCKK